MWATSHRQHKGGADLNMLVPDAVLSLAEHFLLSHSCKALNFVLSTLIFNVVIFERLDFLTPYFLKLLSNTTFKFLYLGSCELLSSPEERHINHKIHCWRKLKTRNSVDTEKIFRGKRSDIFCVNFFSLHYKGKNRLYAPGWVNIG